MNIDVNISPTASAGRFLHLAAARSCGALLARGQQTFAAPTKEEGGHLRLSAAEVYGVNINIWLIYG